MIPSVLKLITESIIYWVSYEAVTEKMRRFRQWIGQIFKRAIYVWVIQPLKVRQK